MLNAKIWMPLKWSKKETNHPLKVLRSVYLDIFFDSMWRHWLGNNNHIPLNVEPEENLVRKWLISAKHCISIIQASPWTFFQHWCWISQWVKFPNNTFLSPCHSMGFVHILTLVMWLLKRSSEWTYSFTQSSYVYFPSSVFTCWPLKIEHSISSSFFKLCALCYRNEI